MNGIIKGTKIVNSIIIFTDNKGNILPLNPTKIKKWTSIDSVNPIDIDKAIKEFSPSTKLLLMELEK